MMEKSTAILPSVSNAPADFLIIGSPSDRRVELFQAALARLGLPPARFISYLDLLHEPSRLDLLAQQIRPSTIVRIESPGKSLEVERALLAYGAAEGDPEDPTGRIYERISTNTLKTLPPEKGRLLSSRQWYLGYCRLLHTLEQYITPARVMNCPSDILCQFDKPRCHALLSQHAIAVPAATGPVHSYDQIIAAMNRRNWQRVFIKQAHGSSASGVIAYRFNGARHQAITTIEMVRAGNELHLYNSRRIRVYTDAKEIAMLINALCRQRVHIERWLPKATFAGKVLDLRVVVIAGQTRHVVARLSHSPMTNLHLLNQRGDVEAVLARTGAERWEQARKTCERAASLFTSLYTGVDLLFTSGFKQHALVEMNAFGDLLPGVLYNEQDTYTAEVSTILQAETTGVL